LLKGDFAKAEDVALAFANAQSEAFGLAAEVLTEQRILDSGEHGEWAVKDAQRFAAIGLAANPESARLKELQALVDTRAEGLARGEPIETLDWEGMPDVELNRRAISFGKAGEYQLAEIAARRSVPLALLRTGQESSNYAAALGQHAESLQKLAAYDEAEPLMREALAVDAKTIGKDHPQYATHLSNLAGLLRAKGDYAGAEPLIREAVRVMESAVGAEHPNSILFRNNLETLLQERGKSQGGV